MSDEKDYSFQVLPEKKRRCVAGQYNTTTHQPNYEIKIGIPEHVRDQVIVNQIMIGNPNDCQWGWDIHNKSTWPAFVTIKKNGQKI